MKTTEDISKPAKSSSDAGSADDLSMQNIESFSRKAIISVISSYGIQFISIALSFVTKIILARLILPDAWGLFAEAILILSAFEIMRDFGISQYLIRHSDPPYGNTLIIEVSISLFFLVLIQFIAPLFSFFSPQIPGILRIIFIAGVIKAFSVVPETYMYRELLFKKSILPSTVTMLVNAGVSAFLAWQGYGVWSLVYGLILSTFVGTIYYWALFYRYVDLKFTLKHSLDLITGSKYLFLLTAIGFLSARVDIAIAGSLFTPQVTGYYFMAISLILWPARLIEGALFKVLYPVFSKLKDDDERLGHIYRLVTRSVVCIEAPIYVFIFFAADTGVPVLLGPKWLSIVPLVKILAIAAIIDPFSMFGREVLRSIGKDQALILSSLLTTIAVAFGGWFLATRYAIEGLAFSKFLIVGTPLVVIIILRTVRENFWRLSKDLLFVYLTLFPSMVAVNYLVSENDILRLVLSAGLACILWIGYYNLYIKDKIDTAKRILLGSN